MEFFFSFGRRASFAYFMMLYRKSNNDFIVPLINHHQRIDVWRGRDAPRISFRCDKTFRHFLYNFIVIYSHTTRCLYCSHRVCVLSQFNVCFALLLLIFSRFLFQTKTRWIHTKSWNCPENRNWWSRALARQRKTSKRLKRKSNLNII